MTAILFTQMALDECISKAVAILGYKTPTPVQAKCIPAILDGRDLVACAQTGTGKTAAFVLPALQKLTLTKDSEKRTTKPRILILTPTRELATQITRAATGYGKFMRFQLATLVGGMPYRQQLRDLSRGADMIVATPGRLLDHLQNRRVDLSGLEMLVLDEADRMLDMGFIDDVKQIAKKAPSICQTLLFSATIDSRMSGIIRQLLKNPVTIDLSEETRSPTKITQKIYLADNPHHKSQMFRHLLQTENFFRTIIFSGTKINADRLAGDLCDQGFSAAPLHGDLNQSKRNRTVEQFQRGKIQFLVATDVAARGIHVPDVTHVINYDLPKFCEDYVHRIGRTGRAGKSGIAISFSMPSDARHLQKIERFISQQIERESIPGMEPKRTQGAGASEGRRPPRRKTASRNGNGPKKPAQKRSFHPAEKRGIEKRRGRSSFRAG